MMGGGQDPLEPYLAATRGRSRQCPSAEVLANFAADLLPAEQAAAIGAHVNSCGLCDSLLERIREFDNQEDLSPIAVPGERRIRRKVFPKAPWQVFLHPAVAYGIALLAVVLAVLPALRVRPHSLPPAPVALESVRTFDLNVTRGNAGHGFALRPGDRFLLLSFLLDMRPAFRYMASLDGGPSREISSTDGRGNFAILYSRELLAPGAHRLVVAETNPRAGTTERSFEFNFQLLL